MISFPATTSIYLYRNPADLRKGFDGLLGLAQQQMECDPLEGGVFVFINRRRNRVKLLLWDGDGLMILYKRLERGCFEMPPVDDNATSITLTTTELAMLLGGIELASAKRRKRYARSA